MTCSQSEENDRLVPKISSNQVLIQTKLIIWALDRESLAKSQVEILESVWKDQLKTESPSLAKAIYQANRTRLLWSVFWMMVLQTARLALPFVVREIIAWIVSEKTDNSVYVYIGLLAFLALFFGFGWSILFEYQEITSHRIRLQVNTLIYKKVLRLSLSGQDHIGKKTAKSFLHEVSTLTLVYRTVSNLYR